jgi:hypothetical protein
MQIWRYLLAVDDREDLAKFDNVRSFGRRVFGAFLVTQTSGVKNDIPLPGLIGPPLVELAKYELENDAERSKWANKVYAFRSLAKRLKGAEPKRKSSIKPVDADGIFREHVSYLSPRVIHDGKIIESVRTVIYLPMNKDGTRTPIQTFEDASSQLWQAVYGSMVFDSFGGVCARCSRELRTTEKTHRPRRGDYCRSCKEMVRQHAMPPERRKKLKAEAMKRYRDNLKNRNLKLVKGEP